MDHLLECAEAFEQLLDVQYHIVLGRKNRLTELPPPALIQQSFIIQLDYINCEISVWQEGIVRRYFIKYFQKRFTWKISKRAVIFRKYKIVCSSLIKQSIFQTAIKQFFCRSFFQKGEKDYTKGQAVYTLLKKEITIVSTGKTVVQYDRLMLRCWGQKVF